MACLHAIALALGLALATFDTPLASPADAAVPDAWNAEATAESSAEAVVPTAPNAEVVSSATSSAGTVLPAAPNAEAVEPAAPGAGAVVLLAANAEAVVPIAPNAEAAGPTTSNADAAVLAALKQGNSIALMRHAEAPGVGDPPGWKLGDCTTQRNLSDRGRAQARALGARLRAEHVIPAQVLSSPWCRCLDTARLLDVGAVKVEPAFSNAFVLNEQSAALRDGARALLGRWRGPGVLLVVTHGENIQALTGRSLAPAEVVVLSMTADGAWRDIGSLAAPPADR